MRTAPPIDTETFTLVLQRDYGLTPASLIFTPIGEAAYGYHLTTLDQRRYYLKLYLKVAQPHGLLTLTTRLHEMGLAFIVAPLMTKNGTVTTQVEGHPLAVFPFIDGKLPIDSPMSSSQLTAVGSVLARLHQTATIASHITKDLPREAFQPMRHAEFTRILSAIPEKVTSAHPHQRQTAEMLSPLREVIADEYANYEAVCKRLQARDLPFVLCHGDPTGGNILYTPPPHEEVYLIDWDGMMLAPKERDLVFFGGAAEDAIMQGYKQVMGETLLEDDVLRYYQYVWNIGEICDFGTSLFFTDHSAEQHQHDYERFDHFLNYSGLRIRGRGRLSDEW